jgi:deazaflavin-dependent oxidoreductase (nitroreductase family)
VIRYFAAMPSNAALKRMNAIHRLMIKVTGGRIGWKGMKMPVLELTTIGRKSGQPRTVLLMSPIQDGDAVVVVASRGGDDVHPAWFLNLSQNPQVEVSFQGKPKEARRARVATAEERARLWPLLTAEHKIYADYQNKTTREIPLVLLEPPV